MAHGAITILLYTHNFYPQNSIILTVMLTTANSFLRSTDDTSLYYITSFVERTLTRLAACY